MQKAGPQAAPGDSLAWLAFFLIVLSARFLLIARYGSETPMEDEWAAVCLLLYGPYLHGSLHAGDLFALWQEHRIFTTRLYELLMLWLDGGVWSPVQQMIGNAFINAGAATGLSWLFMRSCPGAYRPVYFLLSLVLWGLPLAVENVLMGFQTQVYLFILCSYVLLWALVRAEVFSRLWLVGMACAVLGLLSMAPAALSLICGAAFLGLRYARLGGRRSDILVMALLLAAAALSIATTPTSHGWQAHPVREVAWAFVQVSSWPGINGFCLIIYLPLVIFVWQQLRRPPAARDESWFLFVMALWVAAQLFAISYARTDKLLVTRYDDIFVIGLLLSFLCALRREQALATVRAALPEAERPPPPYMPFSQLWLLVVLGGIIFYCTFLVRELDKKMEWAPQAEQNVRHYLETGDFSFLATHDFPEVPYYNKPELKRMLDDPATVAILPTNLVPANAARQPALMKALVAHLQGVGLVLLLAGVLSLGGYVLRQQRPLARTDN